VLIGQDGSIPFSAPLTGAVVAVVLLILALVPPREGLPVATWLVAAAGPLVLLAIAHALPLGWHHPWIAADLATLAGRGSATVANQWSIDPGRSLDSATWIAALAVLVWCLLALFPVRRLPQLADGVVLALATYAAWALALSVISGATGQRTWAVGGFAYHNHAGAAWAACLPLALVQAYTRGGWRWVVPALLTIALVHSASRAAIILGLLVSGPLLVSLLPRQRRWIVFAAVATVLAGLFALIGTGAASERFRDLGEDQTATTLNGRVLIWNAAMPVIREAQPFGSGAGTAGMAMQRGAGIDVTGEITHLHSEPLELLLEFGWAGALVILAGLALGGVLLRRARVPSAAAGGLKLGLGAGLGLLILGLHSLTDYILHNPAIDLIAVALIAVWVQSLAQPTRGVPLAWKRGLIVCTGLVLMMTAALSTWREHELRLSARPTGAGESVAACTPEFAAAMAEKLREHPEEARRWCDLAARLAPGSAAAWRVRTLADVHAGQTATALDASERLLVWAPDWDAGQDAVLGCLEHLPDDLAHGQRAMTLARTLLAADRVWSHTAWATFARVLGDAPLADIITHIKPERVRAAALPWLRQHADLVAWQTVRLSVKLRQPLDPIQWRIVSDDRDPRSFSVHIRPDRDGRREQAERCLRAGLGLPPALDEALADDGDSGTIHRQLAQALGGAAPAALRSDLDRLLHLPWARPWWKLLHEQESLARGQWTSLDEQSHPPLLEQGAALATGHGDTAAAARLRVMLSAYRHPSWFDAGWGVRWCWLLNDGDPPALTCSRWTGVFVDGKWLGWYRGQLDVGRLTGSGLHHVVLADPP
jgi:O-antigen ligase